MSRRRSNEPRPLVRRLTLIGTGVLVVGVTGALVALGGPVVGLVASPESTGDVEQVTVPPGERELVCPGPARLADPEAVGDSQFGSSPVETETTLQAAIAGVGDDVTAEVTALDGSAGRDLRPGDDAAVLTVNGAKHGSVVRATPGADPTVRATASTGSTTTAGDLRGLAAASCAAPAIEQWLIGGSTEIGSSAQLVLQNPGLTATTVQVSVWGPSGPVTLTGGGQYLLAPGEEIATLVEASVPEQRRLAVHVKAEGGLVGAYIQHNTLAGLVPMGVDYIVAGAAPSTAVAVSGVVSAGEAVDAVDAPQLRLLAPGEEAGGARISVYGPDGLVRLRGGEEIALGAGVVTDVSLGGLPKGPYTIAVDATVPVVAGALMVRVGDPVPDSLSDDPQYDRAWLAATPLSGDAGSDLGQIALLKETTGVITVGAVPVERGDPAEDPDPVGEFRGVVQAFDDKGKLIGSHDLTIPAGASVSVGAADLRDDAEGSAVAAVVTLDRDPSDDGSTVGTWSALLSAGPALSGAADGAPGTLISVLQPVPASPGQETVAVRETDTAGLGR